MTRAIGQHTDERLRQLEPAVDPQLMAGMGDDQGSAALTELFETSGDMASFGRGASRARAILAQRIAGVNSRRSSFLDTSRGPGKNTPRVNERSLRLYRCR
jgi:hypothetical protein